MKVFRQDQIEGVIVPQRVIEAVESGFAALALGQVRIPPVGHLILDDPPGDVHIKYGYRKGDDVYVIKVASGFYKNPLRGLRTGSGLMLVFCADTGKPLALLHDEGYLTTLRTAAAGAVAAKYLAPCNISTIGIIGSGHQARMQLDYLRYVTRCRNVLLWARNREKAEAVRVAGFEIEATDSLEALFDGCRLVVTTTASHAPLVTSEMVRAGTHITAVGADSPGKQELAVDLFHRAALYIVDSRAQCFKHGEAAHVAERYPDACGGFVELGEVVNNPSLRRSTDDEVTIADLTGVAIQDIEIAKLAYAGLLRSR